MTPKEKAKELVDKYYNLESEGDKGGWMTKNDAKQCALIAVDEILKSNPTIIDCNGTEFNYKFWTEVKKEIEKL